MDQQYITLGVALLGIVSTWITVWINSKTTIKVAKDKLDSDEKQNTIKTKLELKKALYLEYFEFLSKINSHLIRMINEPKYRTDNEVVNSFSSSLNKLKLVSDSKIVIRLFEIDRNYMLTHAFIMRRVLNFMDKEINYQFMSEKQAQLQLQADDLKLEIDNLSKSKVSETNELRELFREINSGLIELIESNSKLFTSISTFRKNLMKDCFIKIDELDRLNKEILLMMRMDIGLENDTELLDYLEKSNSGDLRKAISDLLDFEMPD